MEIDCCDNYIYQADELFFKNIHIVKNTSWMILNNGTKIKIYHDCTAIDDENLCYYSSLNFVRLVDEENCNRIVFEENYGSVREVEVIYPPVFVNTDMSISIAKRIRFTNNCGCQQKSCLLFCKSIIAGKTGYYVAVDHIGGNDNPEFHFHLENNPGSRYKMKMSFIPSCVSQINGKTLDEAFYSGKKSLYWETHKHGKVDYRGNDSMKTKQVVHQTCLKLKGKVPIDCFSDLSPDSRQLYHEV